VITAEPDDVRYAVFLTPDQRGGHHDHRPRQSAVRAGVRRRVPAALTLAGSLPLRVDEDELLAG
jgi:hypothetical protein